MFSLIITVQSLAFNVDFAALLAAKVYRLANEATTELDDDYSIPCLIWPPPISPIRNYELYAFLLPPLNPPYCFQQLIGDSLWLQQ